MGVKSRYPRGKPFNLITLITPPFSISLYDFVTIYWRHEHTLADEDETYSELISELNVLVGTGLLPLH